MMLRTTYSCWTDLPALRAALLLVLLGAGLTLILPRSLAAQETGGAFSESRILVEIPLPLTVVAGADRTRLVVRGQVDDSMNLVSVEAQPIIDAISERVLPVILQNLELAGEDGWFTAEELEQQSWSISFDRYQLAVEIRIPVTALGPQTLSLYQERQLPGYGIAENAPVALGTPLWSQFRSLNAANSESISAFSLRAAPGLHLYNWVLESDLRVEWINREGGSQSEYSMENTRLVRFWEESGYRLQAGQIINYTRGLQAPLQLLGASFDNLEAATGRGLLPALLERPLIVDEAGTIDVYLNERRIRSYPVQPGQYDVRDLPLTPGINTARVEYHRATGLVERYELVIPHSGGLLVPGALSYALALGVEEEDLEMPAGSGFLRYGLRDTVTAGVLADGSTRGAQVGFELVTATPIGEPLIGGYGSVDDAFKPGWAAQAGYRLALPGRTTLPALSTTAEYRDRAYIRPGASSTASPQAWQLTSSLSQNLPGQIGLSVGHIYRTYHEDLPVSSVLYAALARNLGPRLGLRVTGSMDTRDPAENWTLKITVSSRTARGNLSGSATVDARNATMDLGGSATRQGPVALSTGARISTFDLERGTVGGISGTARAAASRFDLSGSGGVAFTPGESPGDQEISSSNYAVQLGSGLYFAGGAVGLGAPTRSSFALIRPDRDLPTRTVTVRTGGAGAPRQSDRLGPAFMASLAPGSRTPINVEVPELPADFSLGRTQFVLAPGYRSGAVITIVSLPRLYVRGRILDAQGNGLVYKGLVITPLFEVPEELSDPPLEGASFTDDQGTFEVYGLVPGDYSIILRDGTDRQAVFTVPAEPGPLVILNDIPLQGGSR